MVTFESLSGNDKTRIYLGFMWRGMMIGIGSMIVAGLSGGVLGFIVGFAVHLKYLPDTTLSTVRWVSFALGIGIGLWFLWIYVSWLFRSTIGGYQIRLIRPSASAGRGAGEADQRLTG